MLPIDYIMTLQFIKKISAQDIKKLMTFDTRLPGNAHFSSCGQIVWLKQNAYKDQVDERDQPEHQAPTISADYS